MALMDGMLVLAAILVFIIGAVHSYLGERHIFKRLLILDNLPLLRHDRKYTENVIRYAWHLTSIAWWGLACVIVSLSGTQANPAVIGLVAGGTLVLTGLVIIVTAGKRHPAWWLFIVSGSLTIIATC